MKAFYNQVETLLKKNEKNVSPSPNKYGTFFNSQNICPIPPKKSTKIEKEIVIKGNSIYLKKKILNVLIIKFLALN